MLTEGVVFTLPWLTITPSSQNNLYYFQCQSMSMNWVFCQNKNPTNKPWQLAINQAGRICIQYHSLLHFSDDHFQIWHIHCLFRWFEQVFLKSPRRLSVKASVYFPLYQRKAYITILIYIYIYIYIDIYIYRSSIQGNTKLSVQSSVRARFACQ